VNRLATAVLLTAVLGSQQVSPAGAPTVIDIALQEGGRFHGLLVTRSGAVQAGALVVISQRGRPVAATKTNEAGKFFFRGLRGGVYRLESKTSRTLCRLWVPNTAPPAARESAMVVAGSSVTRAQSLDNTTPAIQGAIAGGLITAGTYWIIDRNDNDSTTANAANTNSVQSSETVGSGLNSEAIMSEPDWAHDLKQSGS